MIRASEMATTEPVQTPQWRGIADGDTRLYDMGEVTIGSVRLWVRSGMVWDHGTETKENQVRCWDVRAHSTAGKSYASEWFDTFEEARQLYDIFTVELSAELIAPVRDGPHIIDRLYKLAADVELAKGGIV